MQSKYLRLRKRKIRVSLNYFIRVRQNNIKRPKKKIKFYTLILRVYDKISKEIPAVKLMNYINKKKSTSQILPSTGKKLLCLFLFRSKFLLL